MQNSNLGFHLLTTHKIAYYNKPKAKHMSLTKKNALYMCVDINCYYAQVEMRRNQVEPYPVSIGGWRDEKGVVKGIVATSNYAARRYGVKTGMSSFEAVSICPHLIMFPVDYEYYVELSDRLHKIFHNYSHQVEMYSIDEAFLNMTGHVKNKSEAENLIKNLKSEIWETLNLTVSVGLSFTKTYAKILADLNKPEGEIVLIDPKDVYRKIYPLDVTKVWGIAKKQARRLSSFGIRRIVDLAFSRLTLIQKIFGPREGELLWRMARGEESTKIIEKEEFKKNIGYMHTFPKASLSFEEIWSEIQRGIDIISYRLRKHKIKGKLFYVWLRQEKTVKVYDHTELSCNVQSSDCNSLIGMNKMIYKLMTPILMKVIDKKLEIRGIGIYATELKPAHVLQFDLFEKDLIKESELDHSLDLIKNKHGFSKIILANELEFVQGRTHFVDRS
jgi:DNA polymerase IV